MRVQPTTRNERARPFIQATDIFWWEVKGTRVIQIIGKLDPLLIFATYVIENFITKFYVVTWKPELFSCDQQSHIYVEGPSVILSSIIRLSQVQIVTGN
jgi:hypothetical protein